MTDITSFTGENLFLNNRWPCKIKFEGEIYPSVEHAFEAARTLDKEERIQFATIHMRSLEVKRAGKFITERPNWDRHRLAIMNNLVTQKFLNGPILMKLLIETDGLLIDGNSWGETFWGESPLGTGQNQLGHILMRLRAKLQAGYKGQV